MFVCLCLCTYHSYSVLMQTYKDPMHAYDHCVPINISKATVKTIHKLEDSWSVPKYACEQIDWASAQPMQQSEFQAHNSHGVYTSVHCVPLRDPHHSQQKGTEAGPRR